MHSVLQDYIQKANYFGYFPTLLSGKHADARTKAIAKQRRIDGHNKPFHVGALGNVQGLTRFRDLANTRKYYGIPDWLKVDEADTYQFGEKKRFRNSKGKRVQKDELLEELIYTKVFDFVTLITSTSHDWLWLPKEFDTENNIYIEPLKDYKGWNDTVKVVEVENYFLELKEALKQKKPLPILLRLVQ